MASTRRDAAVGLVAGIAATVPMTAAMELMHRRLPPQEQYPLPPREITMSVANAVGVDQHLDEPQREALSLLSHFGYGAAAGAVFAPVARRVPIPFAVTGIVFALGIWVVSYLGWLPAARILPPATQHPARRNALMIAAHIIWGGTMGAITGALTGRRDD